jgi:hypothetical protein
MPAQAVDKALAAIEKDKSKALGLAFAKHPNIQPDQFIPRAGIISFPFFSPSLLTYANTPSNFSPLSWSCKQMSN